MFLRFSLRVGLLTASLLFFFESSIADDTDRKFTNVGKIGLTITNYGTIGDRNDYYDQGQPSCQYPLGNRDPIEHIYQGGLWVGAVPRTHPELFGVSTGAHDRLYTTVNSGEPVVRPEFSSDSGATVMSRSNDVGSAYFSENAVSNQDYVSWYTDKYTVNPTTGLQIPHHTPLNINVRQESYAWKYPYVDFFVILNYTIYNASADTLDSLYVGLWNNGVVRKTTKNRPGTPGYFDHGANGYMDTLRLMYTFDFDGLPSNALDANADSYVAVKLLGTAPFPIGVDSADDLRPRTNFNAWKFRATAGINAAYFSPLDDQSNVQARSRYDRLKFPLQNDAPPNDFINQLRTRADNMATLLSVGPFVSLNPGDSLNVVFGIICARKSGTALARNDTRDQRKTLIANAVSCQRAYDGEDVNGNNRLDPGEDLNGNGRLDHYLLPQPPHEPKIHLEVGNQTAAIYWDKSSSEQSLDPISHRHDFEGYRVYRSNAGADFSSSDLLLTLSLAGEFDIVDSIGYDTGLNQVSLSQPKYFPPDTVAYWYKFPPSGLNITHLNGWQYLYGVSAFDQGDSAFGVTSLESKVQIGRVVPGTPSTSDVSKEVRVYPNPYYVNAVWDGTGERSRKIYFYNLPNRCEIRVYTLSGDVVANLIHDGSTYDGSDIDWFKPFNSSGTALQFAGGEHAWDLITKFDQAIATGLYLFSVKDSQTGEMKTGKFLVIK